MVVNLYRCFGTIYRPHLQGSRGLNTWPLKMRPIGCPETSVRIYYHTLSNSPEEHRSHVLRGWNPKSSKMGRIYRTSPSGSSYLRRPNFATRHPAVISCFSNPRGNCCYSTFKYATTTSSHIFLSYICHSDTIPTRYCACTATTLQVISLRKNICTVQRDTQCSCAD